MFIDSAVLQLVLIFREVVRDESQSSCSCASSHRHVQLHSISHPFCFKLWTRFFLKTKIQEDDCQSKLPNRRHLQTLWHWPARFWILFNCLMAQVLYCITVKGCHFLNLLGFSSCSNTWFLFTYSFIHITEHDLSYLHQHVLKYQ